jgi:acetyl-CoA carboxylase biotin carboxylase subunit
MECRINAEDPFRGWIPSPGTITGLRPATGPWVRDDSGAYEGYTVPRWYDTLVAKLIVWADDRPAAIERMLRALAEYTVVGVRTTIPALARIVAHPDFRAGRLSTAFLERVLPDLRPQDSRFATIATIAAVLAEHERARQTDVAPAPDDAGPSRWRLAGRPGWTAP